MTRPLTGAALKASLRKEARDLADRHASIIRQVADSANLQDRSPNPIYDQVLHDSDWRAGRSW